jgi:KaiC/GvpD/RAD55 family RecA-like ATPase
VEQTQLLASAIQDRNAFDFLDSRTARADLSPSEQTIYTEVGEYYANDEKARSVSVELLKQRIQQHHPKYADMLGAVLDELPKVSTDNVIDLWLSAKQRSVGLRLADALTNSAKSTTVTSLIDEYLHYQKYEEAETRTYIGVSPLEFIQEGRSQLIPIYPLALNNAIGGGAERGSNVAVFGVPEVGKTQFVVNMVARQLLEGFKVLYCGNEDPIETMVRRFISRLTDIPANTIREWVYTKERDKLSRAYDVAMTKGYSNLILPTDFNPGTFTQIKNLIEEHQPDVLVVDQIRNMDIPNKEGYTDILDTGSKLMRDIGKRHGVTCVSVTQAGDNAHGKAVLHYRDVHYSKTGFAGPFDLIIGVGATNDMMNLNQLCMSTSKCKLNGRHTSIMGRVCRATSKIKSL